MTQEVQWTQKKTARPVDWFEGPIDAGPGSSTLRSGADQLRWRRRRGNLMLFLTGRMNLHGDAKSG